MRARDLIVSGLFCYDSALLNQFIKLVQNLEIYLGSAEGLQTLQPRHQITYQASGTLEFEACPVASTLVAVFLKCVPVREFLTLTYGHEDVTVHCGSVRIAQHAESARKTDWLWHQDHSFHRTDRDLTIWIALSECGVDAPAVEFLTLPFNEYEPISTDQNYGEGWAIERSRAEFLRHLYPAVRPVMVPGDCLIFDGFDVHRTQ